MAVELLLLSGGAAAARLPVFVLPPDTGQQLAGTRGALPGLPAHVRERRLTRAGRCAVSQRPRGRRRGPGVPGRYLRDARGFQCRPLIGLLRLTAPGPLAAIASAVSPFSR